MNRQRFVPIVVADEIQNRGEGFLLHDGRRGRDLDNRRPHVDPVGRHAVADATPAMHRPSLLDRLPQSRFHGRPGLFVDQRSHQDPRLPRVADRQPAVDRLQAGQQIVRDLLVHDQPPQRRAPLAAGPHRREGHGPDRQLEVGRRGHDHPVVAPQFQQRATQPSGHGGTHRSAHPHRTGGRDQGQARIGRHRLTYRRPVAENQVGDLGRDVVHLPGHPRGNRLAGHRTQGGLLRRFPDQRVAADQGQHGVPGPDGDREVKGGDHPHHAQRVPLFGQAVFGPFRGDRQAVELAGEPDGEVADVDHLLDFADGLLSDLAGLGADQHGQVFPSSSQGLADPTYVLAPPRSGHGPPAEKRLVGRGHDGIELFWPSRGEGGQRGPIDGRTNLQFGPAASLPGIANRDRLRGRRQAEAVEQAVQIRRHRDQLSVKGYRLPCVDGLRYCYREKEGWQCAAHGMGTRWPARRLRGAQPDGGRFRRASAPNPPVPPGSDRPAGPVPRSTRSSWPADHSTAWAILRKTPSAAFPICLAGKGGKLSGPRGRAHCGAGWDP